MPENSRTSVLFEQRSSPSTSSIDSSAINEDPASHGSTQSRVIPPRSSRTCAEDTVTSFQRNAVPLFQENCHSQLGKFELELLKVERGLQVFIFTVRGSSILSTGSRRRPTDTRRGSHAAPIRPNGTQSPLGGSLRRSGPA